ncbi:MAG: NHLP leader peptide family RiPP precursor [Cyanobacteria bacterium P01_A01_bin.83]
MNQQQPNQQPQSRRDIEARIIAKAWKDESYKQELLSNPKAIFEREFGVELPEEVSVQVLEENSTTLNFVLPMAPQTIGREISEEELEMVAGGGKSSAIAATITRVTTVITLAGGWAASQADP